MVRPVHFHFNVQTSSSNHFQHNDAKDPHEIQSQAQKEFDTMVTTLRDNHITVEVFEDNLYPETPDSIFPNNWFSTHQNGLVVIYPMQAKNRRLEKREDIINFIRSQYSDPKTLDLSPFEEENKFLEGTGSMVLDREAKIAYACLSVRTDRDALKYWATQTGYSLMVFEATDQNSNPIYHTNVMMGLGTDWVVICLESIRNSEQRSVVLSSLERTGKTIIEISFVQMNEFAGNVLELRNNNNNEKFVVISKRAYASLNPQQIQQFEKFVQPIVCEIPTIETYGGGGVRCMLAEIF